MGDLFIDREPSLEDCWRGIVLFGKNVASYKFALAKALLEMRPVAGQLVKMGELAVPFSKHICNHLQNADKQGSFATSKFLDACRKRNAGEISDEELRDQTERLGFINVIYAFHIIGSKEVPKRFYLDERKGNDGIRITDEFTAMMEGHQATNLSTEAESRWRLVETAWELGISRNLVSIDYDPSTESLFALDITRRRKAVTSSRGALNGYQKGKCFYCHSDIHVSGDALSTDVDHFFPHVLKQFNFGPIIDGVWNLVLACKGCNRGVGGKFACVPSIRLLERLWLRNEYLITSHHPLRETLMRQTGRTEPLRRTFLNDFHNRAKSTLIHTWDPDR